MFKGGKFKKKGLFEHELSREGNQLITELNEMITMITFCFSNPSSVSATSQDAFQSFMNEDFEYVESEWFITPQSWIHINLKGKK